MNPTEGMASFGFRNRPFATVILYLLLVVGGILFLLPFLWLVSTSFKVDRELFSGERAALPIAPNARMASPFIDKDYYRGALSDLTRPHFDAVLALVRELKVDIPEFTDRQEAEAEVAKGVLRKLEASLPAEEWMKGDLRLIEKARGALNPMLLQELFQNVYRRLEIGNVTVRSAQLEDEVLGSGESIEQRFENRTPKVAKVVQSVDRGTTTAVILYDFSKGDQVVLERTFDTRLDVREFARITLGIRADDNWQRLNIAVERCGELYVSVRPTYMSNFDRVMLIWQGPGPDDESNRIKNWVHITKVDSGPKYESDPHKIKVRLTLERTNQLQAWWGKIALNYRVTAQYIPFTQYVCTSLYLIILNVSLMLLSSSLVAYGVSRLQWPGRDMVFLLIIATLMIPEQVTMIPVFLIWKWLGAYNTLVPLWLGSAFGAAVNIFLLRQFMKTIPRDVEDAAKIDGCGVLRVYWHIILPLVKPTLAAIALLTIVGGWNDFKGPLLYVADQRLYSLAFGLYAFSVQVANNPAQTMAASVLMTLPVIALFFFAQKHFISGVTLTGINK